MKTITLGIGLKSGQEDWFTSSSLVDGVTRERLREIAAWVFEEAKHRLVTGGWEPTRPVTITVTAHAETVQRVVDENEDVATFHPAEDAREMLGHLFSEAMRLLYRGPRHDG